MHSKADIIACGAAVLSCAAVFVAYGPTLEAVELAALIVVLVAAARIDAATRRIPNALVAAACVIRIAYIAAAGVFGLEDAAGLLVESFAGAAVMGLGLAAVTLAMDRATGVSNMGGGDIKLFAAIGLCFGVPKALVVLASSCVMGALFAVLQKGRRASESVGPQGTFAFAPFIAVSSIMVALLSSPLKIFL